MAQTTTNYPIESTDPFEIWAAIAGGTSNRRSKITPGAVFNELQEFHWKPIFAERFYDDIVAAGFNRVTIKQAFVLAQIVQEVGPISVRGAFYRAVSAGIFPDTGEKHYRTAGGILLKLRRKGCLSYSRIVDSLRRREKPSSWSGLADFMETVGDAYRKDLWGRQRECVEVFVEKDAMAGVLEPVTREYDVNLNIIRGDTSDTFVWNIAEEWNQIEKPICAYYLGDHDPSGLRIEQTVRKKLTSFCNKTFEWKRLAITREDFFAPDILGFSIKGNRDSKTWQTKHKAYLHSFGDRCVEVDALPPKTIRERVKNAIESHIDAGEWSRLQEIEAAERDTVKSFVLAQKAGAAR